MALAAYENDTWMFTAAGMVGHEPPADREGMLSFIEDFTPPAIVSALRCAEPLGDVARYRTPSSRWRRYDKMQRDYLKTLVSDELIDEHRRCPLGQHSEPLERLLLYFRRQPQVDKYAIVAVEPFKAYRIVALSGHRGVAPRVVEDKTYGSQEEAYHGVFLRRVQDLLES